MVKSLLGRELSCFWFVEHSGILSILGRKLLFDPFYCLSKGSREGELSDVGMVLSKYSLDLCLPFLLSADCSSIVERGLLAGPQVPYKVSLFNYFGFIMPVDRGPYHVNFSSSPVNSQIVLC